MLLLLQRVDVGNDALVFVDYDVVHLQHMRAEEVLVADLLVAQVAVVLARRRVLSLRLLGLKEHLSYGSCKNLTSYE